MTSPDEPIDRKLDHGNRLADIKRQHKIHQEKKLDEDYLRLLAQTPDPAPDDPASRLPQDKIERLAGKRFSEWMFAPNMRSIPPVNCNKADDEHGATKKAGDAKRAQMTEMYRAGLLDPWIEDPKKRAFPLPEEAPEELPRPVPPSPLGGAEE